jgi:penicillin-binding protein 1C
MREVSGVSGAAPIMHDVFEYLHQRFGTTWFANPSNIVVRDVHPLTGKLAAEPRSETVREKFRRDQLPQMESPADYDNAGRVLLPAEYQSWLRTAENRLDGRVSASPIDPQLRVISPLPGTTYILDPDIATSGRVPLIASGASKLLWQSDSLVCRAAAGASYAIATEGEHHLTVIDAETGFRAATWIRVRSL